MEQSAKTQELLWESETSPEKIALAFSSKKKCQRIIVVENTTHAAIKAKIVPESWFGRAGKTIYRRRLEAQA